MVKSARCEQREAAVALSTEEASRFASLLEEHKDELVGSWTERVTASMRGRLSQAELQRQIADLRKGFQSALAGGAANLSSEASAELRAQLTELSSLRARQGFSATETAVSVFAVKEALVDLLQGDSV